MHFPAQRSVTAMHGRASSITPNLIRTSLLCLCVLLGAYYVHNQWRLLDHGQLSQPQTEAFSLLVTLNFSAVEYKDEFLKLIQIVSDHVRTSEPDTLAYKVLLSNKDPLQVLVLERYRDKEIAYLQVHKSSAPFLDFRPKLAAMQNAGHVTISGESYIDSEIGFSNRG